VPNGGILVNRRFLYDFGGIWNSERENYYTSREKIVYMFHTLFKRTGDARRRPSPVITSYTALTALTACTTFTAITSITTFDFDFDFD